MSQILILIGLAISTFIVGCLQARRHSRIRNREEIASNIEIKFGKIFDKCINTATVIIFLTIFICSLMIAFKLFIGHYRFVSKNSMNPTLVNGDKVFVERLTLFFSKPKRGDIMAFSQPSYEKVPNTPFDVFGRITGLYCRDTIAVKRVIGLPGEKILIKPDETGKSTVYINGKKLNENYIITDPNNYCDKLIYGPYIVPKDSYFMLGDNRDNSIDSRDWSGLGMSRFIKRDKFIAKVAFVIYPHNKIKWL